MEISLSHLKSLANKNVSEFEKTYHKITDLKYWCQNSSKLDRNNKIFIHGYVCLHRRNYRPIVVDNTGWLYVQFLNLTSAQHSEKLKSSHVLKKIQIEAFNLVVELVPQVEPDKHHQKFIYIQTDLTKCSLTPTQIDWGRIPAECDQSVRLTNELVKFYVKAETSPQLKHCCFFRVENAGQISSTLYSSQMLQMKSRLRAHIRVQFLADPNNPSIRPFYFLIALFSKHVFYYNFLHEGNVYMLMSENPIQEYIPSSDQSSSDKSTVSILRIDDTMRIFDDFQLPDSLSVKTNELTANDLVEFDPDVEYVDRLSGILVEKHLSTKKTIEPTATDFEANEILVKDLDLIVPNCELRLVLRPLKNLSHTVVVFFENRLNLYELGIVPGMIICLLNLTKRPGERHFKTSFYMTASFDQRENFFAVADAASSSSPPSQADTLTITAAVSKKKASLYENLIQMDTIYDCFYKDYTASNFISNASKHKKANIKSTNSDENIQRLSLYFKWALDQVDSSSFSSSHHRRILAQLIGIYDFHIKITCRRCARLSNVPCPCGENRDNRIEWETTLLVDDHTSILKLAYSCADFEPKLSKQSSHLFGRMADPLMRMIGNYLAEIRLPSIPIREANIQDKFVELIQDTMGISHDTTLGNITVNTTNFDDSSTSSSSSSASTSSTISQQCFNLVKLDVCKALYDYILNMCLDKYYVFYIDMLDAENVRQIDSLVIQGNKNKSYRPKNEFNHFCLGDLDWNKQCNSTLQLRCFKFVPIDVDLNDN